MQESVTPTTMVMNQVPKGAGIQALFAACAAAADWPEVVQTLLEANADVEALSQGTGHTPLMGGAMQANIGAMRQLLRAGASLAETNDFGLTARELAARSHNEAAVLLLDEVPAETGIVRTLLQPWALYEAMSYVRPSCSPIYALTTSPTLLPGLHHCLAGQDHDTRGRFSRPCRSHHRPRG